MMELYKRCFDSFLSTLCTSLTFLTLNNMLDWCSPHKITTITSAKILLFNEKNDLQFDPFINLMK